MRAKAMKASNNQISPFIQPSQPFRLLDLPVEIWSKIVTPLCYRDPVGLNAHRSDLHFKHRLEQPAITRVCKIIREETLPYFYSQNEFMFIDPGNDILQGLQAWFATIGEANYSHIEKLYIYSSCCVEHLENEDLEDHIADLHRRRNFPFVVVGFEDDYTDEPIDPIRIYRLGLPPAGSVE